MMDEQPLCNCPDWRLCQKLKKHINGRLWEIWNGTNIDAKTAQLYRNVWLRKAGLDSEVKATGGCGCGK